MKILVLSQFSEAIACELPSTTDEIRYISEFSAYDPIEDHKANRFDLLVCFGYNRRLPVEHPEFASVRAVNLHTSLLPYGRGLNPNLTAWLNGEPHGLTIHEITSSYDKGAVLFQKRLAGCFDIDSETLRSCYHRKIAIGIGFLAEVWQDLIAGRYQPQAQPEGYGSLMTAAALKSYAPVLAKFNDLPIRDFLQAVSRGDVPCLTQDLSPFSKALPISAI